MIINKNKNNPLFMISFLRNIYEEFKEEQSQSNLLQDEIYYKVCSAAIINFTFSKINLKFVLDCIIGIG